MRQFTSLLLFFSTVLLLSACEQAEQSNEQPIKVAELISNEDPNSPTQASLPSDKAEPKQQFKVIDWVDLIPEDDLKALMNPPSYINDIEDGSVEDQLSNELQSAFAAASDDTYQQALISTRVIEAMDGQSIKIPGFIVPLELSEDQTVTQFFLVPFFGACIHEPPPNQIIFVDFPEGFVLEDMYQPYWISGVLNTALFEDQIATSAYTMNMSSFELYQ